MRSALKTSELDNGFSSYSTPNSRYSASSAKLLQSDEPLKQSFMEPPSYQFQQANFSHLASRAHAVTVSPDDYAALSRERQTLLDKLFDETITRKETRRLTIVRWSLDTLDAARDGHILDGLEDAVQRQKHLDDELERFYEELKSLAKGDREASKRSR